jgi:hypothetical protein
MAGEPLHAVAPGQSSAARIDVGSMVRGTVPPSGLGQVSSAFTPQNEETGEEGTGRKAASGRDPLAAQCRQLALGPHEFRRARPE